MLIVSLIEKDIFTVVTLSRKFFKDALTADTVLCAQLFPKLIANYKQNKQFSKIVQKLTTRLKENKRKIVLV